jgi:uncharacterized membrane-anchored protein YitT (DUF2179 family)
MMQVMIITMILSVVSFSLATNYLINPPHPNPIQMTTLRDILILTLFAPIAIGAFILWKLKL